MNFLRNKNLSLPIVIGLAGGFGFTHSLSAMSSNIPNNYWSCTFRGLENYSLEDNQGILHLESREALYGTDWLPQKEQAYKLAKQECELYSVGPCSLAGCSQKGELR